MNNSTLEIVLDKLLPEKSIRKITLKIFLETINHANALGNDKWGAYFTQDCVRLLVGSLIVFTIEGDGIWLALDRELLETLELKRKALELTDNWQWDTVDYPEYKRIHSKNGYFTPIEDYLEVWPLIKEFYFPFLAKVAHKFDKLKTTSQANHSPELLAYLHRELGQFVPQPDYNNTQNKEPFTLPEEVNESLALFEGSRQRILVNAYERNPIARQECIDFFGAICSVCGFIFSRVYGDIGAGFIHVHHLRKISEIGEEYRVDPIEDLRPVCPNCHAMLHRNNPPFTIEQLRDLIQSIRAKHDLNI